LSTDEQEQRVFWPNGLAGTGKSIVAQTFAEMMFAGGKLGASFFCSRDFED
jgi:adenylylsulfate kinase-like enzyme